MIAERSDHRRALWHVVQINDREVVADQLRTRRQLQHRGVWWRRSWVRSAPVNPYQGRS